jgi:hypothetical protein
VDRAVPSRRGVAAVLLQRSPDRRASGQGTRSLLTVVGALRPAPDAGVVVGRPTDPHEQEADRASQRVATMTQPVGSLDRPPAQASTSA